MNRDATRRPRDRREIEALAEKWLADITISEPFDPDELAKVLTTMLGKSVRLLPITQLRSMVADVDVQDLLDSGITGAIIESDNLLTIAYADDGSEMHQLNVIFHEVGHQLLEHRTEGRVMCRSDFGPACEQEAERFGRHVVLGLTRHDPVQWAPHADDHPGVRRLGGALADTD